MNRAFKITCLVVLSIIALSGTDYVLKQTMRSCKIGTVGKINCVMNHDLDVELTIWGASTAYLNFNPQIRIDSLGYSTMNMGIDGTSIDQYNGLLEEYLSYTEKSKYIIIAIDVHGGLVEREKLYHLHNWLHHVDNLNVRNCLSDIDPGLMRKSKYVPFYDLTLYDKHAFPYFRKTLLYPEDEYIIENHGYQPNSTESIDSTGNPAMAPVSKIPVGERCLKKILDSSILAKEKGITPIIVITPCYEIGFAQLDGGSDVIAAINLLQDEGITVIDLSSSYISTEAKYFKDNTHLNSIGADKLTLLLVTELTEIGDKEEK